MQNGKAVIYLMIAASGRFAWHVEAPVLTLPGEPWRGMPGLFRVDSERVFASVEKASNGLYRADKSGVYLVNDGKVFSKTCDGLPF